MKKIDLGQQGDGPYIHETNFSTPQGAEVRETVFNVQIFTENGKATVLLSEAPENYAEPKMRPLEFDTSGVTYGVMERLEEKGFIEGKALSHIEVIYHRPENIKENNPETFEKVNYSFDGNGLREDFRNPREQLTAEEVAEKIGPENFVEKQFARDEEPAYYARASLMDKDLTDNMSSYQNLNNIASEYDGEYEREPEPQPKHEPKNDFEFEFEP